MNKIIPVKEIAKFVYSSGDLTNEFFSNKSQADGKHAHSYLQRKYNKDSEKEYYIKQEVKLHDDTFIVHGFIDGVLVEDGNIVIEEIKSTQTPLKEITLDFHKEHLAQLMLYSYMYANISNMDQIHIRLTYIHIPEYETKKFDLVKSFSELETFFFDSLEAYSSWLHIVEDKNSESLDSLKNIAFPFQDKREGQYELMKATYYTLKNKQILYAIAPTGIGKTMATMFPALKTLIKKNDKLFYITAKTMGRTVAKDSIKLLMDKGLKIKAIVLSSKAKACATGDKICKPEKCPFAKGYFNKLRTAIEDIYRHTDMFSEDVIDDYAKKYQICPFEFSLDLSEFADLIICDYNYVFDPKAHLIRYFEDDTYKAKILCDEAHNLVDRSKEMYSSELISTDVKKMCDILIEFDKTLFKKYDVFKTLLKEYDELMNENLFFYSHFQDEKINATLNQIYNISFNIFTDHPEFKDRDDALVYFFNLKDYLDTSDYFSENHMFMLKKDNEKNEYTLELRCMDASKFILKTIKDSTDGAVFFSATMYPIDYYMDLISHGEGKYLTLKSPFDNNRLKLIIDDSISTKYKDRNNTISDIVKDIKALVNSKDGNYIVFFPSYQYIDLVLPHLDDIDTNIIVQTRDMTDIDKDTYLGYFEDTTKPHLGLFVMGGSFSEGIDYQGDLLNGVIIVGVGLPQINIENELLKEFFDEKYNQGFDYAYTYPGFNKVVQAAGRVIRTSTDYGVVILIDKRYHFKHYQALMPDNWSNKEEIVEEDTLSHELDEFWMKFDGEKDGKDK